MNLEFMQPRGTEYIRIIVADPCSGLHSLMAIKALHAITAYVSRLRTPWKWVLFFLALPITLAANICRMTLIILVCAFIDKKFGLTLFHDYSPYVLFLFVFLILIGIGQLMERWTGGNAWWKARKAAGAFTYGPAAILPAETAKRMARVTAILAIASCLSSALALWIGNRPPITAASADVASIPKEHLGWKSLGDIESDAETMKQIQADSYINRRYINAKGDVVDLMVVYRRYGRREFAHRPDQCFPAGGYIGVTNRVAALPWAGKDVPAVYWLFDGRAVLRPDGQTGVPMTTVTYFFASANRTEHDFIRQQLWMALERIFPNKNGWTFLRLSSPRVETDQRAMDAQRAFMAAMEPEIRKVITTDEATAGAL
jgi:EpsI family protein